MKNKIILILVILGLVGGWFYWYQWRPVQIRKECLEEVNKRIDEPGEISVKKAENVYGFCLMEHGMKREDLTRKW